MDLPLSKNAYQATFLISVFMVKKGYFSVKKVSKHYRSILPKNRKWNHIKILAKTVD